MSVIAPSQPTRLTHPGLRHHVRLATALAAAALVTAGVPAGAAELRPTAGLPEARQHLLCGGGPAHNAALGSHHG